MADTLKVLGQVAPADTNNADLYTVPEDTQTTVSSLVACNLTGNTPNIRVAVRPLGATVANEHYIYYGKVMVANVQQSLPTKTWYGPTVGSPTDVCTRHVRTFC